jgi:hypothetical protein
MNNKLALIHTGAGVVEQIVGIVRELRPKTEVINIIDDCVVRSIAANGNVVPPWVFRRMATYMILAEEAGAAAALLTCSSISESIDVAKPLVSIPIFKIDEPMADKAVVLSTRIGVAATLKTTLEPTKRLILSRAQVAGTKISLQENLCKGAFEALQKGDALQHDQIVEQGVTDLLSKCDIVVLAQASMARAIERLGPLQERVLTSPRLGVARVVEYLNGQK